MRSFPSLLQTSTAMVLSKPRRFSHQGRDPASPSIVLSSGTTPLSPVPTAWPQGPSPPHTAPAAAVVKSQSQPTLGGHSCGWAGESSTSYTNAVHCPRRDSVANGPKCNVLNCGWQGRATKTPGRAICTLPAFKYECRDDVEL